MGVGSPGWGLEEGALGRQPTLLVVATCCMASPQLKMVTLATTPNFRSFEQAEATDRVLQRQQGDRAVCRPTKRASLRPVEVGLQETR